MAYFNKEVPIILDYETENCQLKELLGLTDYQDD